MVPNVADHTLPLKLINHLTYLMPYHVIRCSRNSVRSILKRTQKRRSQATEGEYFLQSLKPPSGLLLLPCYHIILHPTLSCHILSYFSVVRCYILSCNAIRYAAMPCSILVPVLRVALSISSMSYHAMPYHTIPYHTIPYHNICCLSNTRLVWGATDCWRSFCVSRRTSRILSWACPSASNKLRLVRAQHTTALQCTALKHTTLFRTALFCIALFY